MLFSDRGKLDYPGSALDTGTYIFTMKEKEPTLPYVLSGWANNVYFK